MSCVSGGPSMYWGSNLKAAAYLDCAAFPSSGTGPPPAGVSLSQWLPLRAQLGTAVQVKSRPLRAISLPIVQVGTLPGGIT